MRLHGEVQAYIKFRMSGWPWKRFMSKAAVVRNQSASVMVGKGFNHQFGFEILRKTSFARHQMHDVKFDIRTTPCELHDELSLAAASQNLEIPVILHTRPDICNRPCQRLRGRYGNPGVELSYTGRRRSYFGDIHLPMTIPVVKISTFSSRRSRLRWYDCEDDNHLVAFFGWSVFLIARIYCSRAYKSMPLLDGLCHKENSLQNIALRCKFRKST